MWIPPPPSPLSPPTPPTEHTSDAARQLLAMPWLRGGTTGADHVRQVCNIVNLSTALGVVVAATGGATLSRGPHGIVLATGFRFAFPRAGAFTIGDVVISRRTRERLLSRPALLRHESRHCHQYAWCLGLPMLPLYSGCAGWSLLRTGDPASRNLFERRAGLFDGDYVERPLRRHQPDPAEPDPAEPDPVSSVASSVARVRSRWLARRQHERSGRP